MDCIQWSIDRSRHASIQDLTTHIVAMLFASTHQLPVVRPTPTNESAKIHLPM